MSHYISNDDKGKPVSQKLEPKEVINAHITNFCYEDFEAVERDLYEMCLSDEDYISERLEKMGLSEQAKNFSHLMSGKEVNEVRDQVKAVVERGVRMLNYTYNELHSKDDSIRLSAEKAFHSISAFAKMTPQIHETIVVIANSHPVNSPQFSYLMLLQDSLPQLTNNRILAFKQNEHLCNSMQVLTLMDNSFKNEINNLKINDPQNPRIEQLNAARNLAKHHLHTVARHNAYGMTDTSTMAKIEKKIIYELGAQRQASQSEINSQIAFSANAIKSFGQLVEILQKNVNRNYDPLRDLKEVEAYRAQKEMELDIENSPYAGMEKHMRHENADEFHKDPHKVLVDDDFDPLKLLNDVLDHNQKEQQQKNEQFKAKLEQDDDSPSYSI